MKNDIFVTLNTRDFIKHGKKDRFENEFKTKVRVLNEDFIKELKGMIT
ncbi:MAG: hypothetical protein U9O96_08070 [Candidatus Thermoplasmatota archaeon]|nr:hypothetical protein [Candidatus Thermoplasmatota archaeon]